jgi:hypothetical protein
MPLCTLCDSIDIGANSTGVRCSTHPETILGPYPDLLTRADEGCEGCSFFCKILQSSLDWKDKLDELRHRVVVFESMKLDVRKADKLDRRARGGGDDLLFDVCVPEGYLGT